MTTERLAEIDLVELKGLVEKATAGPWTEVKQSGAGPMIAHEFETGKQMNPVGLRLIAHMLARGNSIDMDKANAAIVALAPTLARQVLALSEEVERLTDVIEDKNEAIAQLCGSHNEKLARAVAAEAEASTLREALGEIREIADNKDKRGWSDFDRVAALAAPKDGENGGHGSQG